METAPEPTVGFVFTGRRAWQVKTLGRTAEVHTLNSGVCRAGRVINQMEAKGTMNVKRNRGQSLVEFALILPAFLMLIMGIVEFGRMMITYAGVASASREAARYGATVGVNPTGVEHFADCAGIRAEAKRVAAIAPITDADISIQYDNPSTGFFEAACPPSQFELGDRIIVSVSITFEPIVPLIDLGSIPMTSETRRTVLRDVYVK